LLSYLIEPGRLYTRLPPGPLSIILSTNSHRLAGRDIPIISRRDQYQLTVSICTSTQQTALTNLV
jgi:hypothetical protein